MTRIASIATYPISVPRPQPVWTAHEEIKAWSVILTEVKTDDGLVGYGLIHGAPMPAICEWVARLAEFVQGMDALAHEAIWDRVFALTSPRPGAIDGNQMRPVPRADRTRFMAALAGIDIALWDLKGKAAGLPVWRLIRTALASGGCAGSRACAPVWRCRRPGRDLSNRYSSPECRARFRTSFWPDASCPRGLTRQLACRPAIPGFRRPSRPAQSRPVAPDAR